MVSTHHILFWLFPQAVCWISNNLHEKLGDIIIFISQIREMRIKELQSQKKQVIQAPADGYKDHISLRMETISRFK